MVSSDIMVWIAAFYTIAATSYVFRDNVFFKFSENTFIGAAAGHAIVMGVRNIITYGWNHIMKGEMIYFIALVLGAMMYFRFHREHYWLYRYPIAFLVGNGIGISIRAAIHSDFIKQIAATATPLTGATGLDTFNNILIFIGCIFALSHFIFTYEGMHKGAIGWVPKVGRWMMLMAFGASFGNTVMTRFGMYAGRILFLLRDWLGIVK